MRVDLTIVGGRLATPEGVSEAGLAVDDGTIVAVSPDAELPSADRTVDVDGRVVMPGVVDPHVHIDGFNSIDTYETGTAAAALGGVTSVINFAWQTWSGEREKHATESVWRDSGSLLDAIERQRRKAVDAYVDYGLHATVTANDPSVFDQFARLPAYGVTSVKFFTAYDIALSNGFLRLAFEELADLDLVALVHTEDASVCGALTDRQRAAGRGHPTDYPAARPDYAEAMALSDAVTLARETECQYYGVHTASELACAELAGAREDGSRVRGETCTHYTALTDAAYDRQGATALQSPPLGSEGDVEALFEALDDGTLSVVSTDHVASKATEKTVDNWWDCPFGVNSLQTSLPVFHTEAVVKRDFSLSDLVRLMCATPAETFGLEKKGRLEVGADADFVVFDPTASYELTDVDNASRADYSVYDGREVTGRVEQTWVRGVRVVDDGAIVAEPGHGEYLSRSIPDWSGRSDV